MFSRRLPWPLHENRLATLLRDKRRRGAPLLDMTESNPTRVGLAYPAGDIAAALADPGSAAYDPDPRGLPAAREAVAAWCGRRGLSARADRMVLTAGTSEAYAMLFKMLADPGETLLVPRPGYPLFDYLAALESVHTKTYPIALDQEWRIDLEALEEALSPRLGTAGGALPRAVVLVNPNNPTGTALRASERARVEALGAACGAAVISDEVFFDYLIGRAGPGDRAQGTGGAAPATADAPVSLSGSERGGTSPALTFTLGGLSKSCGLPQMKLGWILVDGPEALRAAALEQLELIADTYLSVGTPVQRAAGRLLAIGDEIAGLIRSRVAANREVLLDACPAGSACRVLPSDGGWYAVMQVPAVLTEEDLVLTLLGKDDVLVHPGYFFDFPREAFLVLSLLPRPEVFGEALRRILARAAS